MTIKNLTSEESALLIEAIHGKNHFDRRLFCNGLIPLTPEKAEQSDTILEIQPDPLHEQPAGHTEGASAGESAPLVPQNSNVPALPSSSQESNSNIGNTLELLEQIGKLLIMKFLDPMTGSWRNNSISCLDNSISCF